MSLFRYIPIVLLGYAHLIDKSVQVARPAATLSNHHYPSKSLAYKYPQRFHDGQKGINPTKNYNLELWDELEQEGVNIDD